ncbi:MAG: hypothetical protein HWE12_01030 [Oceanospirillaceae bacterium]|nr:hypothetical protein [Oceanospirillaceae bacterium]
MSKEIKAVSTTTINNLVALRNERIKADAKGGVLFKANNYLYNTLADIYFAVSEIVEDKELVKAVREYYAEQRAKEPKSYPAFKTNTPNIYDVCVRLVFADSETTVKRANAYTRVLKILSKTTDAFSNTEELIEYFKANGGIEGIDGDLIKNKEQREKERKAKNSDVAKLKERFVDVKTDYKKTVNISAVDKAAAELAGTNVVLVGVVGKDGSIVVKHVCAEKEFGTRTAANCGAGVVSAALNNMLSVNAEALKELDEKPEPTVGIEAALNNKVNNAIKNRIKQNNADADVELENAA